MVFLCFYCSSTGWQGREFFLIMGHYSAVPTRRQHSWFYLGAVAMIEHRYCFRSCCSWHMRILCGYEREPSNWQKVATVRLSVPATPLLNVIVWPNHLQANFCVCGVRDERQIHRLVTSCTREVHSFFEHSTRTRTSAVFHVRSTTFVPAES